MLHLSPVHPLTAALALTLTSTLTLRMYMPGPPLLDGGHETSGSNSIDANGS